MPSDKKSNPYSRIGLDKFARLNTELSAKREYVAKKKGVPEDAVRFAYRNQGWVPVLLKNNKTNDGQKAAGDLTVASVETKAMASLETKAIQERKLERNEDIERKLERNKYREMKWNGGLEGIHGAIGLIIALFVMIYGGTLYAILWACAWCWWCVLAMLRKGEHGYFHDSKTRIRMTIDVD